MHLYLSGIVLDFITNPVFVFFIKIFPIKTLDIFYYSHAYSSQYPRTHRPRMLLAGPQGYCQSSHLAPAILHHLEQLPVHVLDLPALFAVSAKTPEESCAQVIANFRQDYAKRISFSFEKCHVLLKTVVISL